MYAYIPTEKKEALKCMTIRVVKNTVSEVLPLPFLRPVLVLLMLMLMLMLMLLLPCLFEVLLALSCSFSEEGEG